MPKIPVKFSRMDIIDQAQNRIVASKKKVTVFYLNFLGIPFFNWLDWYDKAYVYIRSVNNFIYFHEEVINADN
jgi:hypothetical protein